MTAPDPKHSDTMVRDEDLRALFAARRPDAARFAAGVAERLARPRFDDDDESDGTAAAPVHTTSGLRTLLDRAASVVPGISSGGGIGKSWAAILSLPFLLLVGVVATFARGFRRVDPSRHRDAPPLSPAERRTHTDFPNRLIALESLLAIGLMVIAAIGGGIAQDAVTIGLLISMMALIWHIGQSARAGVVDPQQVARTMFLTQIVALFGCVFWPGPMLFSGDSLLGNAGVGWILELGLVVTFALSWGLARKADPFMAFALCVVLPLGGLVLQLPSDALARTRHHLQTLYLHPEELSNWSSAGVMGQALQAAGAAPVDLQAVHERLVAALATTPTSRSQDPVHPTVWSTAVALGLLGDDDLRRLAMRDAGRDVDDLLSDSRPLDIGVYRGYLLDCALVAREPTAAQRDHLARRAVAAWPAPDARGDQLEQALFCARWLARLGRDDLLAAQAPQAHELLRRHWVSPRTAAWFSTPGGFCTFPENGQHADIRSTSHAVELMQLVGAPEDLPLREVRAFLRHGFDTSLIGRLLAGRSVLGKEAEASLVLLDRGVGLPAVGTLARLIAERAPLAALLLVALALRAIWLAQRSAMRLVGALP
ncbi:MAG: hypothetical protein H6838_10610 [Planctomycetes bacterium]|nr:hypothetical protein [Planctomycetota bacterium]MCB9885937.1 hypothetical protein [Planctomycetota bacterium]